eukprot:Rmarinus@m.20342
MYHKQGKHKSAMSMFTRALEENDMQCESLLWKASMFMERGDNSSAIPYLQKAVTCDAVETVPMTALGSLALITSEATKAKPDDPKAQKEWAQSLVLLQRLEEAAVHFMVAAQLYASNGQQKDAEECMQLAQMQSDEEQLLENYHRIIQRNSKGKQ